MSGAITRYEDLGSQLDWLFSHVGFGVSPHRSIFTTVKLKTLDHILSFSSKNKNIL